MNNKNWQIKNLSKLVFGCEPLGGTDWGDFDVDKIEEAIRYSLDLGVNFFDTANVYGLGLSESRLSKILGSKRFDLFIATKGGISWERTHGRALTKINLEPSHIKKSVEDSLNRLRLESIPLYYIHWPDANIDMSETFEMLMLLKEQGKIQHIGCSNFNLDQLKDANKITSIDFLQIPINIMIGLPSQNLLSYCKEHEVNIVAYNVLASGLLSGKYDENSKFNSNDRRSRLESFSEKYMEENLNKLKKLTEASEARGLTIIEHSLKWIFEDESIQFAITGIKNKQQIEQNFLALTTN